MGHVKHYRPRFAWKPSISTHRGSVWLIWLGHGLVVRFKRRKPYRPPCECQQLREIGAVCREFGGYRRYIYPSER